MSKRRTKCHRNPDSTGGIVVRLLYLLLMKKCRFQAQISSSTGKVEFELQTLIKFLMFLSGTLRKLIQFVHTYKFKSFWSIRLVLKVFQVFQVFFVYLLLSKTIWLVKQLLKIESTYFQNWWLDTMSKIVNEKVINWTI